MPVDNSTTNVVAIRTSPIRDYARDAVAAVQFDRRQGVLAWRVADYLLGQMRLLAGHSALPLDRVSPRERDFYLGLALTIQALHTSIETDAPPTESELYRYEQRKQRALARSRVRCIATANRHVLSVWRPDPDRPGVELVHCDACGAGASLRQDSGDESVSALLSQPCARQAR